MKIIVVLPSGQNYKLKVNPTDNIKDIKTKIHDDGLHCYTPEKMILIYNEQQLNDNNAIQDYSIQNKSKIHLIYSMKFAYKAEDPSKIVVYIKNTNGDLFKLELNPSDSIEYVKQTIYDENIFFDYPYVFGLNFEGNQLEDGYTLEHYHITNGSTIHIMKRYRGGGFNALYLAECIGNLINDKYHVSGPLLPGNLSLRYIRSTNATYVYEQIGGTCYAYAACSAYINTIIRIYGSRPPPSFRECFEIACYNGSSGGRSDESIRRLEKHFKYGIICDQCDRLLIRDAITISVIIDFSTSQAGWVSVANGSLLEFPGGNASGWHSAVVEGYDLEKDCAILKNSWGNITAAPRFEFTGSAAHDSRITRVYFTLDSIRWKVKEKFVPRLLKCDGSINGNHVDCAWMDKTTAQYTSDYVCEFHPEKKDDLKYYGYNVYQWIKINLNRQENQNKPRYYYSNLDILAHMKQR